MKTKHTPGPWKSNTKYHRAYAIEANNADIATVHLQAIGSLINNANEIAEANAKLIVAAPDLLKAINNLLSLAEDGYKHHCENCCHEEFLKEDRTALYEAREAIKKATT